MSGLFEINYKKVTRGKALVSTTSNGDAETLFLNKHESVKEYSEPTQELTITSITKLKGINEGG